MRAKSSGYKKIEVAGVEKEKKISEPGEMEV